MKYLVISYDKLGNCHQLKNEDGVHRVDLYVDGSLAAVHYETMEEYHAAMQSLVGKEVEIERLQPYEFLAHGVRVLESKS